MSTWTPVRATLVAAAVVAAPGAAVERFDAKTASFAVTFHGETSAYRDAAVVVMPGDAVIFDAVDGPPGDYSAATTSGTLVQQGQRQWKWTAPPRAGAYLVTFDGPGRRDAIAMHAFVPVPADHVRNGLLNGYRIGAYPSSPLKGNPLYLPPRGFIEVTKANEDTKVSPHFTLKQFVCKEDTTNRYPKYVVLHERLPLKLEMILERVNEMGFASDTLHVMSAYRTPYYNHAIGDVKYSMHQWGSAADIYVDPERKDRMADLNRDGAVDTADAKLLYDEIETLLEKPGHRALQGGMGFYPATAAHPPFVHVDVRGTAARWKG
jgi:peptidase M15-like protein